MWLILMRKTLFDLKEMFCLLISTKVLQNIRMVYFNSMWLILMWKHFFYCKDKFYCKFPEKCFKTLEKLSLVLYGSFFAFLFHNDMSLWQDPHFAVNNTFWTSNICCFVNFRKNAFTEKHKLAVCGSFWWEKHFFHLIFFLLISANMLENTRKA